MTVLRRLDSLLEPSQPAVLEMKTSLDKARIAAPKACSHTRRKLAKSKPSKTTFQPTPVSCGITERSLKAKKTAKQ